MTVQAGENREAPDRGNAASHGIPVALGLSLAGTAVVGGVLFALQGNVWWIALASVISLLGGGVYLGRVNRESEPLHGTLLAIFYSGLVLAALFGGTLADVLPDPLPGLSIGDSTFFFVWPLLQLAAGAAGSTIGGRGLPRAECCVMSAGSHNPLQTREDDVQEDLHDGR